MKTKNTKVHKPSPVIAMARRDFIKTFVIGATGAAVSPAGETPALPGGGLRSAEAEQYQETRCAI